MLIFESQDHEKFMREALVEAQFALDAGDLPIGSVIVYKGSVIGRGRNRIHSECNKLRHAELEALQSASDLLFEHHNECVIYTTVEPCVMCLGAITMADIRHCVFGAPDPERGGTDMYSKISYVQSQIHNYMGGILAEECISLLCQYSSS